MRKLNFKSSLPGIIELQKFPVSYTLINYLTYIILIDLQSIYCETRKLIRILNIFLCKTYFAYMSIENILKIFDIILKIFVVSCRVIKVGRCYEKVFSVVGASIFNANLDMFIF